MECSLDNFEESVLWYTKNMTKGKVILKPFGVDKKKVQKEEPIKIEKVEKKKEEKSKKEEKPVKVEKEEELQ